MMASALLFQISLGVGAALGVGFFVVLAVVAFVAFRMLKRTVKMAVRMTIVVVILLVAFIGSTTLFFFTSGGTSGQKPPAAPAKTR